MSGADLELMISTATCTGTEMPDIVMAVIVWGGYLAAGIAVTGWAWHRSRRCNNVLLRNALPAAVGALLFAPTFFACGGVSPLPFPLLIAGDVVLALSPPREYSCGYQTVLNGPIAFITWLLVTLLGLRVDRGREAP